MIFVKLLIAFFALTPRAVHTFGSAAYMTPEHPIAAVIAGYETGLDPELLIAVAWVESRFDATATSRVEDGARHTGRWPSRSQAGKGPWFCGVMQTQAGTDWGACLAQRPLLVGYRAGAAELRYWLRRSHGDVRAALNGHGCGNAGLTGDCRGYGDRVLAWARRLRAAGVTS